MILEYVPYKVLRTPHTHSLEYCCVNLLQGIDFFVFSYASFHQRLELAFNLLAFQ
jgi:hypothetical protein